MRFYNTRLKVQDFVVGSGNASVTFTSPVRDIVFISDDENDIVVTLYGTDWSMAITMKDGDIMDETFRDITSMNIVATGAYRYYVRSEQKQ